MGRPKNMRIFVVFFTKLCSTVTLIPRNPVVDVNSIGEEVEKLAASNKALTKQLSSLQSTMTEMQHELENVQNKQKEATSELVYFTAKVKSDPTGELDRKTNGCFAAKSEDNVDGVVPYVPVEGNYGDAFNHKKGVFQVPVNGSYYFRFDVNECSSSKTLVLLKRNSRNLCRSYSNDEIPEINWLSFGCSAVVHANVGDNIYVELR